MPLNTLLPAFNEDILNGGPEDLGLLMSCMGLGAILGSLMLASMGELRNKGVWLIATCVAWGAFTTGFGSMQVVWGAALLVGIVGWLSAWNMSLNRGMLQHKVAAHMRGRIMSIDMMSHGLMPLGVIPISLIAERYSVAVALEVAGVTFVVVTLALALLTRSVRQVDQDLTTAHPAAGLGMSKD
jgi:sugar phosphate permease